MKLDNRLKVIEQLGVESALPAAKPASRLDRRENQSPSQTILIVDDEPSFIELAAVYLEESEFCLLAGMSVAEGRAHLHSRSDISMVITDLRMPDEDGFAMLQFLRENLRFNHIPAVVSTSCKDYNVVLRSIEAGAQDYLLKPFTRDTLLYRIRKVIERCHKTILLVTENQSTILVLTIALAAEGFNIVNAASGAEAFDIIERGNIDLIVAELALEDMTGLDLMAKAQEIRVGFPFLFLGDPTIRVSSSDIIAGGGCGLIERPFNNLEVIRIVQRVRLQQGVF